MPYINKKDRERVYQVGNYPHNAGELNYLIHILLEEYVERNGESYQIYNDIMGALEGVKLELYRRRIAPYEDLKIKENGDIPFYQPCIGGL